MKIAVPYDNGNVFQHFGRTEAFQYYDVTDGKAVPSGVKETGDIGHEALADLLAENGVDLVICGGLGSGAMEALRAAGIDVISGAGGSADKAVASYLRGELTGSGANCDHHHEEGSGCGDCGSGKDSAAENAQASGEGCGGCGGCGGSCGGCGGCAPFAGEPVEGKNVGKTVRVHYEGTFNDGTVFDSSFDRGEPMEFICGAGQMIHGFDQAVANMEPGETVNVHLMPSEAYGEVNPDGILTFEISRLPGAEQVQVGQRVHLEGDNGQILPVRVTARDENTITLDANHEMAGKELNFRIELLEIR